MRCPVAEGNEEGSAGPQENSTLCRLVGPESFPVFVVLILLLFSSGAESRCLNWCNNRGYCSSDASDAICVCDPGFTGDDCSLRMCPKAYEPLSLSQNARRRTVRLVLDPMHETEGPPVHSVLAFSFSGSTAMLKARPSEMDSAECTRLLGGLKSIDSATCDREAMDVSSGAGSYIIRINDFPLFPHENNIFNHSGNPHLSAFRCNVSAVHDEGEEDGEGAARTPTCTLEDVVADNLPGYYECGNHGTCNRADGACSCERGFHGPACDDTRDFADKVVYSHDGPFFTGNLMKLSANRNRAETFNVLQVQIDGANATTIRGDGLLKHHGNMAVAGTLVLGPEDARSPSVTASHAQLLLLSSSGKEDFIQAHGGDENLIFQLSANGGITSKGGLNAANATFRVEDGRASMLNAEIGRNLDVNGSAFIRGDIQVGPFAAPNVHISSTNGINIQTSQTSGAVLEIMHANDDVEDDAVSLLRLMSRGANTKSLVQAIHNDETVFDIDSVGFVRMAHLQLKSGGILVQSGGLSVQAGGLTVSGGLTLNSGTLHLGNEGLDLSRLSVSNRIHYNSSLLSAESALPNYAGTALDLSVNSTSQDFSFIVARRFEGSALFRVDGRGFIESSSGARLGGEAGLHVTGHSVLEGGVSFSRVSVLAGKEITLSCASSFVEILDDGAVAANELILCEGDPREGHVLMVSNRDAQATTGLADIGPGGVMLLIYDRGEWRGIQASQSSIKELLDINKLTASNDLAIGDVSFSAGLLLSTRLSKGSLVVSDEGGLLTNHANLKFNKGVLSSPALKTSKLLSNVDVSGNEIRNAKIYDAKISDTSIVANDFVISGLRGLAYFDINGRLCNSTTAEFDGDGNLLVNSLHAPLDARGHEISNAVLRSGVVDMKDIQAFKLTTKSLEAGKIRLEEREMRPETLSFLLGVDSDGNLAPLPPSSSPDKHSGVRTSVSLGSVSMDRAQVADELSTKKLKITGLGVEATEGQEADSFLLISHSGDVRHSPRTSVLQGLLDSLNSSDSVSFPSGVSGHFRVEATFEAQSAQVGTLLVRDNVQFSSGQASTLQVDNLSASVASFQETISAEVGKFGLLKAVGNETLILQDALISNALLDNATITNIDSIHSNRLDVTSDAHFGGNVFVGSSLTVQGSVVGSGAYVDSSDVRFKKHIRPFQGALEKLLALSAKTYYFKRDRFPEMNFDASLQFGWIADDVEMQVPEIVSNDARGYKAIAYSRASVLVAEAVKELHLKMDRELQALREQVAFLAALHSATE